tara:strand:- start:150 stop:806 length:657 start_codon:yes stop_codon:yes gene_type:complete
MCGIFSIVSEKDISLDFISKILLELKIRGKHSTGISWIEDGQLKTDIQAVASDEYIIPNIKTKVIIGHTRYSTSSLEYNQPITNKNIAVVHNGVITQKDYKHWQNEEYKFLTKNDSEYIIKSFLLNKHPLIEYPDASISTCVLNKENKTLKYFRNDKRPLWYYQNETSIIAISTKNIFERLDIQGSKKCESCLEYEIDLNKKINIKKNKITKSIKDLQ